MKNTVGGPGYIKIDPLPDFRIDFAAAAALIGPPQFRALPVMPADLPETPVPLAEISQGPNAFEEFLDRNQKNLVILAILLALGAAALVVYRGVQKSLQETGGAALNKAEDLASLQAVINDHSGTGAARSAMVLLADRQWTEGQQDAAVATLRKFIAENPDHPACPSAQASLGSKLMSQGKAPEAGKVFQELIDDPKARFIAPYALISLGDLAKVAGDLGKAEAAYTRVKTDFSESSFAETANRRIANLKAKPPVEIAPPPKAETPTDPAAAIKSALPPGVTVTPGPGPQAPVAETPAPEAAPAAPPVVTPPQEVPAENSSEAKPAEPPVEPQEPQK